MENRPSGRPAWEPSLYLVYLGFLLFEPLFDPKGGPSDWLWLAGLLALFLPIYFWTFRQGGRRVLVGVVAMALLGLGGSLVNSGSTAFFIYAAAAVPRAGGRRTVARSVAGLLALVLVALALSPVPWPFRWFSFMPALVFVPLVALLTSFEAERSRSNARLRMAHDEVERLAAIAERERIARDLHDLLGHTLSTITLKSELAARLAERDPPRARREMLEVERTSREALQLVREAVRGYRSHGLAGELGNAKVALEAAGATFAYHGEAFELGPQQEGVLAMVLREAVTNVVRHAGASRCTVELRGSLGGVELRVSDDGRALTADASDGSGLAGIRERLRALGGTLRLERDGGTTLVARLPTTGAAATGGGPPRSLEEA